jgi:hypothetical protein
VPSVYVDAAQVSFPPKCPHCGQPPEAMRDISAHRLLYSLLSEYVPADSIAVPVCRTGARRRKRLGVIALVGGIAFIFVGGFFTMALVFAGHKIEAAILGGAILVLAALGRTGWDDALLDSWVLGVRARRVRGPGTRLRLTIRRDEYFSEWAATNPAASATAGAIGWRPPPPPVEVDSGPDVLVYSRIIPAIMLLASIVVVALHHWYAVNGGHPFVVGICLITAAGALALGGVVYPPVFWSIGVYGKHLPLPTKIAGALLAIAGLAGGFLLVISYGR